MSEPEPEPEPEPESEPEPEPEESKQEEPIKVTSSAPIIVNDEITKLFKSSSDEMTYQNMMYLTHINEYIIGDKTYKRKMLKPKDLKEFTNLQSELMAVGDTNMEKKLELLEKLGTISLENFTKEDFENTDILMLEQVIAAQFLISKGFRQVDNKSGTTT